MNWQRRQRVAVQNPIEVRVGGVLEEAAAVGVVVVAAEKGAADKAPKCDHGKSLDTAAAYIVGARSWGEHVSIARADGLVPANPPGVGPGC